MALELPEYTAVFANLAYTKRETVILNGDNPMGGKSIDITKVVLPVRYTEPTEDEVVDYLRKKAEELRGPKLILPNGCNNNHGTLDDAIKNLPDKILTDLVNEDETCLRFVRQHTPAHALKEGEAPRQYVHVLYGVIPSQIIENYSQRGEIKSENWFKAALSNDELQKDGFGQKWFAKILLYNGMLPDEDEMFVLIDHCTDNSRTLTVSRTNYDTAEVGDVINALYEGIYASNQGKPTQDHQIGELKDVSDEVLMQMAVGPVKAFHENVKQAAIAQALQGAQALQEKMRASDSGGMVPHGLVQ